MSFSRTDYFWMSGNRVPLRFGWFVMLPLTGCVRVLAHADFRAALLELNLVHEQIDQEDPSPVFGENTLASEWARNLRWVESLPLVLHDNEHSEPTRSPKYSLRTRA